MEITIRKKQMKKMLALFMAMLMMFGCMPVAAFAVDEPAPAMYSQENTIAVGETKIINVGEGETVCLKFIPEESGNYKFYAKSDGGDTYGYLYDSFMEEIAYNDDNPNTGATDFYLEYYLEAGETYYWGARFYDEYESGYFDVSLEGDCTHTNTTEYDAIEATCTTYGYTAGELCNDCNKWVSGHTQIAFKHTDEDADGVCDLCDAVLEKVIVAGETKTVYVGEGETVYLKFIPEESGDYKFYANSDGDDTYGYLYDSLMEEIAYNDDNPNSGGYDFYIESYLEAGVTYYWGARFYDEYDSGSFDVTLEMKCAHKNITEYEAIEPTCTENGYTYGKYCNDCEEWIVKRRVQPGRHIDFDGDGYCERCEESSKVTISVGETKTGYADDLYSYKLYFIPEESGCYRFTSSPDIVDDYGVWARVWDEYEEESYGYESNAEYDNPLAYDVELEAGKTYIYKTNYYDAIVGDITVSLEFICAHENTTNHESSDPTCTENGYSAGVKCDDCGRWIEGHATVYAYHTDNDDDLLCDICGKRVADYIINLGETVNVSSGNCQTAYLKFTPTESGYYSFYSSADSDTYGYLFDRSKQQLASNDDGGEDVGGDGDFLIEAYLESGVTYYWGARYYYEEDSGSFDVTLEIACQHEDTEYRDAVVPTCTEDGYTEGEQCVDCGKWLDGHYRIPSRHTDSDIDGICDRCDEPCMEDITLGESKEFYLGEDENAYFRFIPEESAEYGVVVYRWETSFLYSCILDSDKNIIAEEDYSLSDLSEFYLKADLEEGETYYIGIGYTNGSSGYTGIRVEAVCQHKNTTVIEGEEATCTQNGYTSEEYCDDCDERLSTSEILLSHHTDADNDDVCDICDAEIESISVDETKRVYADYNQTVFYKFIPEVTAEYRFYSDSNWNMLDGYITDENFVTISDDDVDNDFIDGNFVIRKTLEAGKTYYLGAGFDYNSGSFNLKLEVSCYHENTVVYDAVEATCTRSGRTEGKYCEDCYRWYVECERIPAHFVDSNKDGYCDICGGTEETISVDETKSIYVGAGEIAYLKFVPEETGIYRFYSNSEYDTVGYLFEADKESIAYNDDGGTTDFYIEYELHAGETYYWGASFHNEDEKGTFDVTLMKGSCTHENTGGYPAKEPTCFENGYTAYIYCLDCGEDIQQTEGIGAHYVDLNGDYICDICGRKEEPIRVNQRKTVTLNKGEVICFSFTPEESGYYCFYSESDEDTYGRIYDSKRYIYNINDDNWYNGGLDFLIEEYLEAGETYYFSASFRGKSKSGTFDVILEAGEYNDGKVTDGNITDGNVSDGDIKDVPEYRLLNENYYFVKGQHIDIPLVKFSDKGYKHIITDITIPEGLELDNDGRFTGTFTGDFGENGAFLVEFKVAWPEIRNSGYYNYVTIVAVKPENVVNVPEETEEIPLNKFVEAEVSENGEGWFSFTANSDFVTIVMDGDEGGGKKYALSRNTAENDSVKVDIFTEDGLPVRNNMRAGGVGNGRNTRFSVTYGETYYVRVTGGSTRFKLKANSWTPSWADGNIEPERTDPVKISGDTPVQKKFDGDENTLWNVYKFNTEFVVDYGENFADENFSSMYRVASPVNIHVEKTATCNLEIYNAINYKYDPNNEEECWEIGADENQNTLIDELRKDEKEYRFDTVYYLPYETGVVNLKEEVLLYVPVGYYYEDRHIVRCPDENTDTKIENIVEATCTEAGSYDEISYCVDCGYIISSKTVTVSAKGHTEVIDQAVAETCTTTGLTEGKHCSACNQVIVAQTVIPKKGHSFTNYVSDNNATVLADGTKTAKCDNCEEKNTVVDVGSKIILSKPEKILTAQNTTAIRLSWTAVEGATGYRVFVKENGAWKTVATSTGTMYTATNLSAGTKYTYAVRAYAITGGKVIWAPQFTTIETATLTTAPAKVASAQNTSAIKLAWTACPGATGYRVFFKVDGVWRVCLNATTATSHTFTRLPAGTTYTFAVRPYVITSSGIIWSNFTEYTAATLPLAPVTRAVSAAKGKATVSWAEVNGAEAYQVYYRMGNGAYKFYKAYTSPQNLNFTLYSNTNYTFAVRAAKRTSAGWVYGAFTFVNVTVK